MRGGGQLKNNNKTALSFDRGISVNDLKQAPEAQMRSINWLQTLIQKQGLPEKESDLNYKQLKSQVLINQVILWDTSASTLRNNAAAKAKGIILEIFEQAYLNRQRIGLLEFSANEVRLITPCQRVNRSLITPAVSTLLIGGNTPIESGITQAVAMLKQARKNQPGAVSKLTLITDGYFKQLPCKPDFNAQLTIIDINQGSVQTNRCEVLAKSWQAKLMLARGNGVFEKA